jgi:hypothetical protein
VSGKLAIESEQFLLFLCHRLDEWNHGADRHVDIRGRGEEGKKEENGKRQAVYQSHLQFKATPSARPSFEQACSHRTEISKSYSRSHPPCCVELDSLWVEGVTSRGDVFEVKFPS